MFHAHFFSFKAAIIFWVFYAYIFHPRKKLSANSLVLVTVSAAKFTEKVGTYLELEEV